MKGRGKEIKSTRFVTENGDSRDSKVRSSPTDLPVVQVRVWVKITAYSLFIHKIILIYRPCNE